MKAKRLLAFALALIMALGCMGLTAFAEDTPTTTTIKYLEPTYKDGDYTKGISSWSVVEKKDVHVVTASTDFSAGGWFAVTSDITRNEIISSGDLNVYIAPGKKLSVGSIKAESKKVTIYGDGVLYMDNNAPKAIAAGTVIFNGCEVTIYGCSPEIPESAEENGADGGDAITGNVIFNAGSGNLYGGNGSNVKDINYDEGNRNGGKGGLVINGTCHANGGSFYLAFGPGGYGDQFNNGDKKGTIPQGNLTVSDNIVINQGVVKEIAEVDYGSDIKIEAKKYYVVADTTISDKLTITSGTATNYAKGTKVNPTVTELEGYLLDKLYANGTEVTKNATGRFAFTMPEKNVLLTATYTNGTYLDLEASDNTYPDKTTVEQKYTLTQTGETTYNDKTKVKVEWTLPEISASFTQSKTWNPDTMQWDENKNTADIGQKQATFTFTNYSSVKVGVQVSFAKAIGTDNDPYKSEVYTINSTVDTDAKRTVGTTVYGKTITHTYTPAATEFNTLDAGTDVYGTYTLKLIPVYNVTFNMNGHGDAVDTQYIVSDEKVTAPTPDPSATGFSFGGWYKEEGCTTPWNFANDTVTKDTELFAKWISVGYFLDANNQQVGNTFTIEQAGNEAGNVKTLFNNTANATQIVLPEGITVLGNDALKDCTKLTKITLPNTLNVIRGGAFEGCTSLSDISIPSGVTSIPMRAFIDCQSLIEITIPSGVKEINMNAFENCSNLKTVTFASGSKLESIATYSFYKCSALKSITIPSKVSTMGSAVFSDCTALETVVFESGSQLTAINNSTFMKCSSLTSITLPSTVTTINLMAFALCDNLATITLPSGITALGGSVFGGDAKLATVNYLGTVDSWNRIAFGDNWKINAPFTAITIDGTAHALNDDGKTIS